jgi:protein-S-isoprenylcysteine O-methyltransferase Ste14
MTANVAAGVGTLGIVMSVTLIALLIATLMHKSLRIWPTPGVGSWQSYVFWPLFRGLNILCFAMAIVDTAPNLGLPLWLRGIAGGVFAVSVATFLYSFFKLGRENSYGAKDGLVTGGIYQWTRNPQNAMLIVVYGALALASNSGRTALMCMAMITVYGLMVLAEEPWLKNIYGEAYRDYCERVPRFFNWSKALAKLTKIRSS